MQMYIQYVHTRRKIALCYKNNNLHLISWNQHTSNSVTYR